MILPSKHITENQALIGVGAILLGFLERKETVTSLWEKVKTDNSVGTYERYVLALDLLYIIGAIDIADGMICKGAI